MTDADFLAAIVADPTNDALRLVYADWLEERGDARAEYLRIDVEVCQIEPADWRFALLLDRLEALREAVPSSWLDRVGKRFDLVLVSLAKDRIIETIKAYRYATGDGLEAALRWLMGGPLAPSCGIPSDGKRNG